MARPSLNTFAVFGDIVQQPIYHIFSPFQVKHWTKLLFSSKVLNLRVHFLFRKTVYISMLSQNRHKGGARICFCSPRFAAWTIAYYVHCPHRDLSKTQRVITFLLIQFCTWLEFLKRCNILSKYFGVFLKTNWYAFVRAIAKPSMKKKYYLFMN